MAHNSQPSFKMFTCLELNISSCTFSEENDMFLIVVYNPLSRPVSTHVRVPVQGNSYTVRSLIDGMYDKIFKKCIEYHKRLILTLVSDRKK